MNDDGSTAAAFKPDGTLKTYRESLQTNRNHVVLPIVLTEAGWWSVFASCPKMRGSSAAESAGRASRSEPSRSTAPALIDDAAKASH
jgi:hypothetical protein